MKKYLLLNFCLFVFASTLCAQWVAQTSGVTSRLQQLSVVNDDVIWCCGMDATILLTTDGGENWVKKTEPGESWAIYDIYAIDDSTAFITGVDQNNADAVDTKIWKTTDGGTTWVEQYNNVTGFGNGIVMLDENNGVWWGDPDPYPSSKWEILVTSNGGTNWTRVPATNYPGADSSNEEYGSAAGICKFGNNVWFTGFSAVNGTNNSIYHSTDKGLSWSATQLTTVSHNSVSGSLAFNSDSTGVFVGKDGTRAYTSDGGNTWTVETFTTPKLNFVTSIPGANTYLAVGNAGASLITADGGISWSEITGAPVKTLYGVGATSNFAWVCGTTGTILKMSTATGVEDNSICNPKDFELYQNYPNPFNPTTTIKYGLPVESDVKIIVYNTIGQVVSELVNNIQAEGYYEIPFNAVNLTSGIYFYSIESNPVNHGRTYKAVKKMLLIK